MKVKMTHPKDGLEAGIIYDLPDKKAQEYIEADFAVEVVEESKPKRKVKDGDGQNNPI